jgi:small-conductance mechanosensitive channel
MDFYQFYQIAQNNPILILLFFSVLAIVVRYTFEHILKVIFSQTKTVVDDEIFDALENPVLYSFLILGGYIFLNFINIDPNYLETSLNVLKTITTFIWTEAALKVISVLLVAFEKHHSKGDDVADIIPFLKALTRVVTVLVGLFITFAIWGIDVTPLLASAGIAGVAVAFAAKDTVSNLFGGVSVFFDKPYTVGDYVIIDGQYRGEVIEIGIRSTKIKTRDDVLLTVPNSVMTTKAVINETGLDGKLRVRVPIGVAQGTDLEKAEQTIVKTLGKHREVQNVPAPRIRYRKFGDFTVDLEALFVISDPANRGRITHEVIKKLDRDLRKEGIVLPPPQLEIGLKEPK